MTEIDDQYIADRTNTHLNTFIKSADQKASILLTGQLAFLGLYANLLIPSWDSSFAFNVTGGLAGALGLVAITCAGLAVLPRTPDTPMGYFLWESILDRGSRCAYRDDVLSLEDEQAVEALLDENYQLARVADKKYGHLRYSILFSGLMLFFAVVSGVVFLT